MNLQIKQAESEDKEIIADLLEYCYDYPRPALEGIKSTFHELGYQYYIGILENQVQAALRLLPFEQNLRGNLLKMGGIANVVSAPEFRRRGFINQMMIDSFKRMKENNMVISTLYPFKDSFYHQYGYINLESPTFLEINPNAFSKWKNLPNGYTITRKRTKDAIEEFQKMQEIHVANIHGGVQRGPHRWNELYGKALSWVVCAYNPQQELEGILHFKPAGFGYKIFGENIVGNFTRVELHASTLLAMHALFHFIYLNADQIHRVSLPIYHDGMNYFPWLSGFTKAKTHLHMINMGRIIDVMGVFHEFNIPEHIDENDAIMKCKCEITDPYCPWNQGVWLFSLNDNVLNIQKTNDSTCATTISIEGITALLYGSMNITEIEYFKWFTTESSEVRNFFMKLFPPIPYCITEFF